MEDTTTPVTPTDEEVVTPDMPATEGMPAEETAPETPAEETPAV
jgi:hypothetical protein